MKRAFLFPGQGAQTVGMGKDIYEKYEEARRIYDEVEKISNMDIKKLCFEGPDEELNKTENTQLAILTTSLAILAVLKNRGVEADISVGLSLGEYSALIYSGILDFKEGIDLVKKRGYYMGTLLPEEKYSMSAVIGLESNKIDEVCKEIENTGKFVTVANYNCSSQTVISGREDAVLIATEKLKVLGARKIIPLKTSGPFHTQKLIDAKLAYEKELQNVSFKKGNSKVIKNIDGTFYKDSDDIKEILANHIINPVRFDKAIKLMQDERVEEYVEIGPGRTLTGFVKKDNRDAKTYNINNVETLENYLGEVSD